MAVLRYSTERTVKPTFCPVTLDEAKKSCDISESDKTHDEEIGFLIEQAIESVEYESQRSLATQTWRLTLDEFPAYEHPIELKHGPVASVTSVLYDNTNGVETTFSDWELDSGREVIRTAHNKCWPVPRVHPGSVRILYVTGNSLPDIPRNALEAIRHYVKKSFNGCEARDAKYLSLINSLRNGEVFG